MDDEDKIILVGLGTFGTLAYLAIKEIQERDALEEQEKSRMPAKDSEVIKSRHGFFNLEEEIPIYKGILELLFGRK